MSIADKLTYLNETKQLIKESINLTGANITNEPFRDYAVMLRNKLPELVGDPSPIWFNYEHVSGTGTSFSINSYNSIFNYDIKGDTVQNGTPTPDAPIPVNVVSDDNEIVINGKNLFDKSIYIDNYYIDSSGNEVYQNGDFIGDYINIFSGNYIASGSSNIIRCAIYDKNKNFIRRLLSQDGNNLSITISSDEKFIRLSSYKTNLNTLQLEKGSSATTYEAYKGGSYPVNLGDIELCKIGNYQDYIFRNDNLIDYMAEPTVNDCTYQYVDGGIRIITNGEGFDEGIGIPIKGLTVGKKYYARINVTSMTPSGDNNVIYAGISNSTYTQSMDTNVPAQLSMEFTPNQSDVELGIYSDVYPVNSIDFTVKDIFIGVINEYDPAEPHGKWYLHKEVNKVVLDGSDSESWSYPSANRFNLDNALESYYKKDAIVTYYCNYYQGYNQTGSNANFNNEVANVDYGFNLSWAANSNTIRFKDTRYTSTSDFKTWLSSNNVSLYYVLATPTDTEITDANLILQLNSVKLVNGLNNIITVGSDLNPILNIEAIKHLD